jgi:alpha-glucosidase (family GH31 glycosyl hydrolase)
MFAGWVGDQDSDNNGFKDAMANVIHSASKGYLSFGFDIGGYRGSKD